MGTTDSQQRPYLFGDYDGDGDVDRDDVTLWLVLGLKILLPAALVLGWLILLAVVPHVLAPLLKG